MTKIKSFYSRSQGISFLPGKGVSTVKDLLLRPIYMMTAPNHYDPNPELRIQAMGCTDNMFTENSDYNSFSPDTAKKEHHRLVTALRDLGATVILDHGVEGQFDGVYTADPSFSMMKLQIDKDKIVGVDLKTIASKFHNISRSPEVGRQVNGSIAFFVRYLREKFQLNVTSQVQYPTIDGEGTGDNVISPYDGTLFAGCREKREVFNPKFGRSDPDFYKIILEQMGFAQNNGFSFIVQQGWFHCDTVLAPLQKGEIVVYPAGMKDEHYKALQRRAQEGKLIVIDERDAKNYAANLICLGDNILVTAKTTPELSQQLMAQGYHHEQININEQFVEKSGGGTHCLVNQLNQMQPKDYASAVRQLQYE